MCPDEQGWPIWIILFYKWCVRTHASSSLLSREKKLTFFNLLDQVCVGVFGGRFVDTVYNVFADQLYSLAQVYEQIQQGLLYQQ